MTDRYFVDTNVFVYDQDPTDAVKHARATAWLEALWTRRLGRVSAQVLTELYSVLTRKLPMPVEDARAMVDTLSAWEPVATTPELSEDLQDGGNYGGVVVVNPFRVDPTTRFAGTHAHDAP
jgi:predicted nucleic acid-binding protein